MIIRSYSIKFLLLDIKSNKSSTIKMTWIWYYYNLWTLTHLCFIFVPWYQPQIFQKMRADLASMWSPTSRTGNPRRFSVKDNLIPLDENSSTSFYNESLTFNEDASIKVRVFTCKGSFYLFVCMIMRFD